MRKSTITALNSYINKESDSIQNQIELLNEQLNEWLSVDEKRDIISKSILLQRQAEMLLNIIEIIQNDRK